MLSGCGVRFLTLSKVRGQGLELESEIQVPGITFCNGSLGSQPWSVVESGI